MFRKNFILCGLTGWCMEIIFTSFGAFLRQDMRLIGQTSLWMFPIYGLAAFIKPVYASIKKLPMLLRGSIYTCGIFTCEYITGMIFEIIIDVLHFGMILKKHQLCPWDYSQSPVNINGVIRLDYAPFWLLAGLLFERIVTRTVKD